MSRISTCSICDHVHTTRYTKIAITTTVLLIFERITFHGSSLHRILSMKKIVLIDLIELQTNVPTKTKKCIDRRKCSDDI